MPQQTTFLAGKYRGSVRNIGFLDESSNNTTIVYKIKLLKVVSHHIIHQKNIGVYIFDGSGDNLTTATSSDFTFGTGDFTIECFAFPTRPTSEWC